MYFRPVLIKFHSAFFFLKKKNFQNEAKSRSFGIYETSSPLTEALSEKRVGSPLWRARLAWGAYVTLSGRDASYWFISTLWTEPKWGDYRENHGPSLIRFFFCHKCPYLNFFQFWNVAQWTPPQLTNNL